MKLIGIAGTNGSGKDTLGEIAAGKGWEFISVTDILREGLRKQGLPIERENLRNLSAQWRLESGLGVLVDRAVEMFKQGGSNYKGLVISSLRNPGEADAVHALGGTVVWIDADPKVRYERIYSRARSNEDRKTYDQFLAEEEAEMESGGHETALHMAAVKKKADVFLTNDADVEAFKLQAERSLKL